MKEFHLSQQKELGEFKIEFENSPPEVKIIKKGVSINGRFEIKRWYFNTLINGEKMIFVAPKSTVDFLVKNNLPDFLIGSDYYLKIINRKRDGYSNPEYIKSHK
jgi:hypothetical protein